LLRVAPPEATHREESSRDLLILPALVALFLCPASASRRIGASLASWNHGALNASTCWAISTSVRGRAARMSRRMMSWESQDVGDVHREGPEVARWLHHVLLESLPGNVSSKGPAAPAAALIPDGDCSPHLPLASKLFGREKATRSRWRICTWSFERRGRSKAVMGCWR